MHLTVLTYFTWHRFTKLKGEETYNAADALAAVCDASFDCGL